MRMRMRGRGRGRGRAERVYRSGKAGRQDLIRIEVIEVERAVRTELSVLSLSLTP